MWKSLRVMLYEFKLPDLGEGITEGEIVKWLATEGNEIKEDQPMVEVMTDKATVQIPSPTSGKVKQIFAREGQTVKVGTTIILLDTQQKVGSESGEREQREQHKHKEGGHLQQQEARPPTTRSSGGLPQPAVQQQQIRVAVATPATRKLARELAVDIESISGSGVGGRITEEDVQKAASLRKGKESQQLAETAQATSPITKFSQLRQTELAQRPHSAALTEDKPSQVVLGEEDERLPLHGLRKRIAEKMAKSVRTAVHATHIDEVDFTQLLALKEKLKPVAQSNDVRLTILPFIMKATVSVLKQFPYFNASLDDEKQEIVLKKYYNIGFATDTTGGLTVPVVKNVDKKSILELAREIGELSAKARDGKLTLEDIRDGTFTITNIGKLGGIMGTPIINFPEVAILGVPKIQKRPVVRENQIVIRDMGFLAISFDHRLVDGADAARFVVKLIEFLENPGLLALDLGDYLPNRGMLGSMF